jgi:hypothetical protein
MRPGVALPTPYVDPVGLAHLPPGWRQACAAASPRRRSLALLLAAVLALVTLATSVLSLGAYCLTSDGFDASRLPAAATSGQPSASGAD